MEANRPPILKKVTSPTSEESVQLLKSIDSSLGIVAELSKRGIGLPKETNEFNPRRKKNPLEDIQKSLVEFRKSIDNSLDVSSLSKEDARSYLETRKKQAEKERDAIVDAIDEMKTSLFKKKSMTEEDVGTLNELNKIYGTLKAQEEQNDRDEEEKRSWLSEKLESLGDTVGKHFQTGFMTAATGITVGLMGPLNLIAKPIEDLFGFQFANIFESLLFPDKDKKKDLNRKFIKPKRSDMMKYNPEAVYLADMIAGPGAEGTEADSIIDKLFGGKAVGMAGKILPFLAKAIPIAAIIGSLVWAVFDGIKASALAEEWGVSSTEAFMGGFLAGTGSGWKNAFKNAGKWALMGAGVGMLIFGPIGALAGGLIGALYGGVLGFIGGETVAKGIKSVGDGLKKIWIEGDIFDKILGIPTFLTQKINEGLATLYSTIPTMIASIFIKDEKKLDKFKKGSKDFFSFFIELVNPIALVNLIKNYYGTLLNIKNIFKDDSLSKSAKFKEILKQVLLMPFQGLLKTNIVKKSVDGFKWFGRWFYKFFMVKELGGVLSKVFKKLGIRDWAKDNVLAPIGKFFKNAVGGISSGLEWISDKVLAPIAEFFQKAWDALGDSWVKVNVLIPIADFFKKMFNEAFDGLSWIKDNVLAPIGTFFGDLFTATAELETGQFFKEKVINPIKEFFSYIGNLFGFIFSGEINILDIILGVTKNGQKELAESLDNYVKAKQVMETDDYKKFDTEAQSKDKDWNNKSVSDKYKAYKSARNVNDAIITPQGRVIIPSSDDTIIATKNPVNKRNKSFAGNDNDIQDLLSEKLDNKESFDDNRIVKALERVVAAIEEKPFNNVMTNVSNNKEPNFNDLRFAF